MNDEWFLNMSSKSACFPSLILLKYLQEYVIRELPLKNSQKMLSLTELKSKHIVNKAKDYLS